MTADEGALRKRVAEALNMLGTAAAEIGTEEGCFATDHTTFRFISPLADGADQIAADVALENGWELQAILPFGRAAYRDHLGDSAARVQFDGLLARANCILELPGDGHDVIAAYVMAGRAIVAHSDVLLAVWDGLPGRGRGGTADVVQLALNKGTAILHLSAAHDGPTRLLWSAFDPNVLTVAEHEGVERALEPSIVVSMLRRLLLPPPDAQERTCLAGFAAERLRPFRARIEYSLLLAAAGARSFKPLGLITRQYRAQVEQEWQSYRERCADPSQIAAPIDLLERAYIWADQLATHFAHTYRSGHIFNFVLGGFAVCLGLGAFMVPHRQLEGAALEMLITIAVLVNAVVGNRNEWHRRWLDYRQLAERLRPMRSLKLLGIAAPDPPGTVINPVPRRWIDWYAAAVWRGMGCPSGIIDPCRAAALARAIGDHEVAPQVTYHEMNAREINQLDRRLNQVGMALFAGTLIASLATLIGQATGAAWVRDYSNWFTLVQAGFPALGTSIFGIRFQADFGGDAIRSRATAATLRQIDEELRKDVTLARAADLAEQAARTMLTDLDEWRLVNQQRELEIS